METTYIVVLLKIIPTGVEHRILDREIEGSSASSDIGGK